jgi:hypothetical protein
LAEPPPAAPTPRLKLPFFYPPSPNSLFPKTSLTGFFSGRFWFSRFIATQLSRRIYRHPDNPGNDSSTPAGTYCIHTPTTVEQADRGGAVILPPEGRNGRAVACSPWRGVFRSFAVGGGGAHGGGYCKFSLLPRHPSSYPLTSFSSRVFSLRRFPLAHSRFRILNGQACGRRTRCTYPTFRPLYSI